jgi:hypothetical protein
MLLNLRDLSLLDNIQSILNATAVKIAFELWLLELIEMEDDMSAAKHAMLV